MTDSSQVPDSAPSPEASPERDVSPGRGGATTAGTRPPIPPAANRQSLRDPLPSVWHRETAPSRAWTPDPARTAVLDPSVPSFAQGPGRLSMGPFPAPAPPAAASGAVADPGSAGSSLDEPAPWRRRRLEPAPTPHFGPPGKHRPLALMVLLWVFTLGLYGVVWQRRVNREMGDFDPRIRVHPARSGWAITLPVLLGALVAMAAAARIVSVHMGVHAPVPDVLSPEHVVYALAAPLAVPYVLLLLPISLLSVAFTAERVRTVEDHAGVSPEAQIHPAGVVGWLLFPVAGPLVVLGAQQRRLNRLWDLAAV